MWAELGYVAVMLGGVTALLHVYYGRRNHEHVYTGEHVVVTGGSQGLGRALAEELFLMGAKVTIMARTESKLAKAKEELQALGKTRSGTGSIDYVAMDVTDFDKVRAAMEKATEKNGEIQSIFLSAGKAQPGYFLEQDMQVFRSTMEQNYLGSAACAKAVAELMVKAKTQGEIVFISSAAACASFIGYSSYAPTKAAVRSLADALRNELKGFGISVRIAYPPDTDTPGFEEENLTKPKETTLVSPPEVYSAKSVADKIIDGCLRGEYHLPSPDFVQNMLVSTSVNITPRGRLAFLEIALAPVLALAMLAFNFHADRVAVSYGKRILEAARK